MDDDDFIGVKILLSVCAWEILGKIPYIVSWKKRLAKLENNFLMCVDMAYFDTYIMKH